MNDKIIELWEQAGGTFSRGNQHDWPHAKIDDLGKFADLLVKKCAYLVNDQQRTTGYTTHAQMLCREFGIEYKDEDYFGG